MVDGVDVDITREDGSIGTDKAKLIDFKHRRIMTGLQSINIRLLKMGITATDVLFL